MGRYNGNATAVHDLVRETEVHRDVYIDQEVFDLEMQHLFANTWIYVGHDSQVPNAGDYFSTTIGTAAGPDCPPHRRRGARPLQPVPAQGYAHHHRHLRQCRKILPLPLSRLVVQDRRLAARDPVAQGLREHGPGAKPRRQGDGPRPPCQKLSRLRIRQDERRRAGLRGIFRRKSFHNRQHGRSLAGWTAGSGRRRVAPHSQLQLENAGRKPDRHLPSDGRS